MAKCTVPDQLLESYRGTNMVLADPEKLAAFLAPQASAAEREAAHKAPMWIIDPLGNLMMQFTADADPISVRDAIRKPLRTSRIGSEFGRTHSLALPAAGVCHLVPYSCSDHVRCLRASERLRSG